MTAMRFRDFVLASRVGVVVELHYEGSEVCEFPFGHPESEEFEEAIEDVFGEVVDGTWKFDSSSIAEIWAETGLQPVKVIAKMDLEKWLELFDEFEATKSGIGSRATLSDSATGFTCSMGQAHRGD